MLSKEIKKFFWEYDDIEINQEENWFFIIERLIEYGDLASIRWIMNKYDEKRLIEVVKKSRNISKKSASIWKNYYKLQDGQISACRGACCWIAGQKSACRVQVVGRMVKKAHVVCMSLD